MPDPRVTERTFYPALMEVIREKGGQGVQEVQFNSVPDILFELAGSPWLLSVKVGETPAIIKDAFLQYLRHKEESHSERFGMLVLLPESVRRVTATEDSVRQAVAQNTVTALIDAGDVKEELRDRPFSAVIDFLVSDVMQRLARAEGTYYGLGLVISLLQQQVTEMMQQIHVEESTLLSLVTDRHLLSDLGHLSQRNAEAVARFLGSYIFLSQVLFLRLLAATNPGLIPIQTPATHARLRRAFAHIHAINYRPIYRLDVLDTIDERYLRDTFDLLWGLEVERVRYELPGRIFHELMPTEIRKMLASFYTRPHAADLLARLTLDHSTATVFDPACGSGTILTSAYRQKLRLFRAERRPGNPHKRFCETEIFGADIMPFAVHLTCANLSAMDTATLIEGTQIIQGDSLRLRHANYVPGVSETLFPQVAVAQSRQEEEREVELGPMDAVLMNPPFTKVERGIRQFVDMVTFHDKCGGEVGLWGHFIFLAEAFLKQDGVFGGVIPINILRGRESERVRQFLFTQWTPLYILKPTRNYGFSEWSEYRDVLFIAKKGRPPENHDVRFALVKKDLTKLTDADIEAIATTVKTASERDDDLVSMDSFPLTEVTQRLDNLMWFCGVTDFRHRDTIVNLVRKFRGTLTGVPEHYFREGYRPVPKGVSQFLFLTRATDNARIQQAFLHFDRDQDPDITAQSPLGADYVISKNHLTPTLRTSIGLHCMDITDELDYIANQNYAALRRVCRAAGQDVPTREFWTHVGHELRAVETQIVVSHRINPFSPSTYLNAFVSNTRFSPSNQLNVIVEPNIERAQALCVLLNSCIFFSQFFLLKEESTGRYINIRFYDLEQMLLYPADRLVRPLCRVFQASRRQAFPALRYQFDQHFDQRYDEFWERESGSTQQRLFAVLDSPIEPAPERLEFDRQVVAAMGVEVSEAELRALYETIVKEMMIIRHLTRD